MLIMVALLLRQLRESARSFFSSTNVLPEGVVLGRKQEFHRNPQDDPKPERVLQGWEPVAALILLYCGGVMVAHQPGYILEAKTHAPSVQFYFVLVCVFICPHMRVFVLRSL
jgi:hypothetical protein